MLVDELHQFPARAGISQTKTVSRKWSTKGTDAKNARLKVLVDKLRAN